MKKWKIILIGILIFIAGLVVNSILTKVTLHRLNLKDATDSYNKCLLIYPNGQEITCKQQAEVDRNLVNCLNGVFYGKKIWTVRGEKY